ncbi:alpha/beta hydrolase [Lapillicoccus jejuensis]|uniref:Alpha/beta hydrolase family protein n=1 Tax=Lapillicoccus jejuensis TaxID=402171 RepID=A0A542E1R4_9MICO|nr:alpha/beta hydrolase [Lapillicoccus jejuensis]TQJ09276.1 alpha/beta hydrolase family protein [Lapillicoccus jejuensis]
MADVPDAAPRPTPLTRWRAAVGVLWVLVAAGCAWAARGSLLESHPAYGALLAAVLVVGLLLLASGARRRRRPARHRVATAVGRVLGAVVSVAVLGACVYLVPLTASPEAVGAMVSVDGVRVADSPTRIVLTPPAGDTGDTGAAGPTTGLVFLPGAKVDPRAYVPLLARLASRGYLVVVVKEPLDIAFLAVGETGRVLDAYPQVRHWAVGGHSLGGVVAGQEAGSDARIGGLLLWASYPLSSLADRSGLRAASVSGTRDGLTTPADVEASRAKLPAGTTYTAVPGAVHAFFGDYGAQPGDGTPTTDRSTAQTRIVEASAALLASLSG